MRAGEQMGTSIRPTRPAPPPAAPRPPGTAASALAAAERLVPQILHDRLAQLQRMTGLPTVFGGAALPGGQQPAERLVISVLRGNLTDSLSGLSVPVGTGLGGKAIARGEPIVVNDYANARGITHDYDQQVVDHERITSVFAVPILAQGQVLGVFYGAVRERLPIGDVALRRAVAIAYKIERDLRDLLQAPPPQPPPPARHPDPPRLDARRANHTEILSELRSIAGEIADPALRERLDRVRYSLSSTPGRSQRPALRLAPREVDTLQLVAVGASNAEIAERLGLSAETVKAYLRSAMRKLEVRNRTEAVYAAQQVGVLRHPGM